MALWFHHLGIVVRDDIEGATDLYCDLLEATPWKHGITTKEEHGHKAVVVSVGDSSLEILQPIHDRGWTGKAFTEHLAEKGEGLYHLSYFTDDFDVQLARLRDRGYQVTEGSETLVEGVDLRYAMLTPDQTRGVWIEIVDASNLPEDLVD